MKTLACLSRRLRAAIAIVVMAVVTINAPAGWARPVEPVGAATRARLWEEATGILRDGMESRIEVIGDVRFLGDEHVARAMARTVQEIRVAAARELLKDADPKAIEVLTRFLTAPGTSLNHEQSHQAAIIVELFAQDPPAAREVIATILARDTIDIEYGGAAEALWRIDQDGARKTLSDAVARNRVPMVVAFYNAASGKPDRLPVDTLDAMLKSEVPSIRLMAACERARAGDGSVVPELAANLAGERTNDIDLFGDQHLAVHALGDLYAKGGRAALVKMLPDKRPFSGLGTTVGDLATWEIMDRATIADVPLIEAFCADPEQRSRALPVLIRISLEAARPWIARGMKDKDLHIRLRSALELARTGDDAAISYLEACCYQDLGVGGLPGQYLISADQPKARAAYMRVFKVAAEPGDDARHRAARANDGFGAMEELVPMLKDVFAIASEDQLRGLWNSLAGRRHGLDKIEPILDAALASKQYAALVGAVQNAALETEAQKKLAGKFLSACLDSDVAMEAARIGHARGLLTAEAIRAVAHRYLSDPDHRERCLEFLTDLGTEEDLAALAAIVAEPAAAVPAYQQFHERFVNVKRAAAVRSILGRMP